MCDVYNKNADNLRIEQNERIVKNSEVDQQWADWLAPARRSFLFGVGAAAIGLTLGEAADAAVPADSAPSPSGPAAAFAELNGPIKPYVSADAGVSEWGYDTLKQPTVQPKGLWPGTENGLPAKPRAYTDIKSYHAHFYFDNDTSPANRDARCHLRSTESNACTDWTGEVVKYRPISLILGRLR
jgi:DOPA 4,5-dioxygenase